jgi:Mce-associated membrane protein
VREEEVVNGTGLTRPAATSSDGSAAELDVEPEEPVGFDEPDEFDEVDEAEDEFGVLSEYRARPFWLRTSTLVVFVVLLFAVSGGVTAWLRISDLQQRVDALEAQTLASEDARQVAILLAADLATYDYRDLGGNFRHVKASATPRFADQLRQLTEELGPELQQTRAVATATVRSAGVVRADAGKAVVAVFVDQAVTNTKSAEPHTEHSRMELTLLKQNGEWRLDQAGEL